MVLGILGLALFISVIATHLIFVPINLLSSFHLPSLPLLGVLPSWLGALPGWFTMCGLVWLLAWLLGDR